MNSPERNDINLQDLRQEIDAVDNQLLQLLNQRATLVCKVGELKKTHNVPVVHTDREQSMLARLCRQNSGPLPDEMLTELFQQIIDTMKRLQH